MINKSLKKPLVSLLLPTTSMSRLCSCLFDWNKGKKEEEEERGWILLDNNDKIGSEPTYL